MDGWARQFVEAFDSHDGSRVAALVARKFRWEDLGAGVVFDDRDALAAFLAVSDQFSKDYRFTLVSEQVNAARYALEWEMMGTNTGPFLGGPPTNKRYRIRGVSIGSFDADGKITANRDYYNAAELAQQLRVGMTRRAT